MEDFFLSEYFMLRSMLLIKHGLGIKKYRVQTKKEAITFIREEINKSNVKAIDRFTVY